MTSVVELIKQDHQELNRLFDEYEAGNDQAKEKIAEQICKELENHSKAEESVVYPKLPTDIAEHASEEHRDIEKAIADVRGDHTKVAALRKVVDHHVKEEEDKALPALMDNYADLEALGDRFADAKKLK